MSLRIRILAVLIVSITLSLFLSAIFVTSRISRYIASIYADQALDLLEATKLLVDTQHRDILYYEEALIETRKDQLRHNVTIALGFMEMIHKRYAEGEIDRIEAEREIFDLFNTIRYDEGIGYFWINDTGRPFPRMFVHPTRPELNGEILDDPQFNCALGVGENLFKAFVDVTEAEGRGYVDYFWPKPTETGLSEDEPKLSYVEKFHSWDMILGTGVYMDDIDWDVKKKYDEVIDLLNVTLDKLKIGKSGYFFIFAEDNYIIAHPNFKEFEALTLINPSTGNLILDDLKQSVPQGGGQLEYLWDKPDDLGNYSHLKEAWTVLYEPLDWYISVSYYREDIEEKVRESLWAIIIGYLFLLGVCLFLSFLMISGINRPVSNLVKTIEVRDAYGIPRKRIPVQGIKEIDIVGNAVNRMIESISTSRKKLEISEKRYRNLFENSGEAILLLDGFVCRDCNLQAAELFAREKESLIGDLIDFNENEQIRTEWETRINRGEQIRFQWKLDRKGLSPIIAETCLNLVKLPDRNLIQAIIRDITEEKRLNEMMVQNEKMLSIGGLAAGMAHEINNPLAGMIQTLNVMAGRLGAKKPRKADIKAAGEAGLDLDALNKYLHMREIPTMIDHIIESGKRASEIIGNMLSFARKGDQTKSSCPIETILDETLKLAETDYDLKKQYDFRSIRIVRRYGKDTPVLSIEKSKVQQVLLNIFRNGAEAMAEEPTEDPCFTIETTNLKERKMVQIEIANNGPALDEETRKRLFEPFYTTKPAGIGTGLGMSISYFIITENHGGELLVESDGIRGCRFIIRLPY